MGSGKKLARCSGLFPCLLPAVSLPDATTRAVGNWAARLRLSVKSLAPSNVPTKPNLWCKSECGVTTSDLYLSLDLGSWLRLNRSISKRDFGAAKPMLSFPAKRITKVAAGLAGSFLDSPLAGFQLGFEFLRIHH